MKRKLTLFVVLALIFAAFFSITANAAIETYRFDLNNTDTLMNACLTTYNQKIYLNNNASIKLDYSNAPGYGIRMNLGQYIPENDQFLHNATKAHWYNANSNFLYPEYNANRAVYMGRYCVAGRIDNDYTGLTCSFGRYNADEVYIASNGGY